MVALNITSTDELKSTRPFSGAASDEAGACGGAVSWGAIIAGATAAAVLSLLMLVLGTGLGLSSISPWTNNGIDAKTFGISTIAWITLTQLVASGLGGYLAGRLRSKWVATHSDEIYFRDTAHGFLAWGVATLVTATLLTSAITTIVSGGIQAGATAAGGAATTAMAAAGGAAANGMGMHGISSGTKQHRDNGGPLEYFVDSLMRPGSNTPASSQPANSGAGNPSDTVKIPPGPASSAAEIARIFANSLQSGAQLPAEDVRYAGQIVAQRTGLNQQEAEKRVTDTYTRIQTKLHEMETSAKEAADKARKASAYAALWLSVTLLVGAFVASLAGVYGGRQRDL